MQTVTKILSKLDLTEKEINVYLNILKHGPLLASEIAKQCGLSRPNAYDIIKKLQAKGLASQLGSAFGKRFKVLSGDEIQELINQKKAEVEVLSEELSKVLPLLKSMEGKTHDPFPKIEFFEGKEGIKKMINKTLQCESKLVKGALSVKSWVELLGEEFTINYVRRKAEKGIQSQTIRLKKGELPDSFYQKHTEQKRDVRYAPDDIQLDATIILFDDYVGLITTKKENIGILIQSNDLSKTHSSWFDYIWKHSKQIK